MEVNIKRIRGEKVCSRNSKSVVRDPSTDLLGRRKERAKESQVQKEGTSSSFGEEALIF